MSRYILSHDLGTSSNKASIFSDKGVLIASETVPYETIYPQRGWAEQEADSWWKAVCCATKKVIKRIDPKQIAVIAVTGHMMGCLPLDKDGNALSRSIIWSDSRAQEECDRLKKILGEDDYYKITGQPIAPNYTIPKIMWLQKNHPEIMDKTDCFLQLKDYINYRLTGERFTDITDATYTLGFDIESLRWSGKVLSAANIDERLLPKVVSSETVIGTVTKAASKECGIPAGIPVVAGAGDGSAAHLGGGCVNEGDTYICLGSSTWIITATNKLIRDSSKRMQSEPHVIKNRYVMGGTMQTGGLAYAWCKDVLTGPKKLSLKEIDAIAEQSNPCSNGTIFMPYLMGERSPWNDAKVNGAFLGLRQETTSADIYRAIMEGVAFNLRIILNVVRQNVNIDNIVLIGGGAKGKIWRQIIADIMELPVLTSSSSETGTSIGCAIIGGVGCGLFDDFSVSREFIKIDEYVEPRKEYFDRYRKQMKIFEDSYWALKEINYAISDLNK